MLGPHLPSLLARAGAGAPSSAAAPTSLALCPQPALCAHAPTEGGGAGGRGPVVHGCWHKVSFVWSWQRTWTLACGWVQGDTVQDGDSICRVTNIIGVNKMAAPTVAVEAINNCKGLSSFEARARAAAQAMQKRDAMTAHAMKLMQQGPCANLSCPCTGPTQPRVFFQAKVPTTEVKLELSASFTSRVWKVCAMT